jgi:hypothetical protein
VADWHAQGSQLFDDRSRRQTGGLEPSDLAAQPLLPWIVWQRLSVGVAHCRWFFGMCRALNGLVLGQRVLHADVADPDAILGHPRSNRPQAQTLGLQPPHLLDRRLLFGDWHEVLMLIMPETEGRRATSELSTSLLLLLDFADSLADPRPPNSLNAPSST